MIMGGQGFVCAILKEIMYHPIFYTQLFQALGDTGGKLKPVEELETVVLALL